MEILERYICDTNIWVNVCLIEKTNLFFKSFNSLYFADSVKNEISKWGRDDNKYNKIHSVFEENERLKSFEVIYLDQLDSVTKNIIEQQLREFGFSEWDNKNSVIKDLGEYISVLYAYHLEIPMLQTDDINFYESIDMVNRFKDIEIMTWNDIASKLTTSDKERISLNKVVETEKQNMREQYNHAREEEIEMKKQLKKLTQRFSKK